VISVVNKRKKENGENAKAERKEKKERERERTKEAIKIVRAREKISYKKMNIIKRS